MNRTITALLLTYLSPLAFAAPLSADQYDNFWRFTPVASDTLSILNLRTINANGRYFWIGKDTTTYCPLQDIPCPPGNETVLDVSGGGAALVSSPYSWRFHDMLSTPSFFVSFNCLLASIPSKEKRHKSSLAYSPLILLFIHRMSQFLVDNPSTSSRVEPLVSHKRTPSTFGTAPS